MRYINNITIIGKIPGANVTNDPKRVRNTSANGATATTNMITATITLMTNHDYEGKQRQ